MKNTFGNAMSVTLFGESHGEAIGAVIDGISPGIKIDEEYIAARLTERRPQGRISTSRVEPDRYEILSGVFEGYATGTPLTVVIRNTSTRSADYKSLYDTPRPSHADYTARVKYNGYADYRGGGHFSGRITAALVLAGSIIRRALEDKGIYIGTHISRLGGVEDRGFLDMAADIAALRGASFPTLDPTAANRMLAVAEDAAKDGDSVGGVLESCVIGMPAGVGEPWFDTLEGELAHILFSVPAVKGVEFGRGFAIADMRGSEANDQLATDGKSVYTLTNNSGGIVGGISNGMPITFKTAIKPTPSIFKTQSTVNLERMENCELNIAGRHDPTIVHRARAVVDAVTAIAIGDMLAQKYGTDWLGEK